MCNRASVRHAADSPSSPRRSRGRDYFFADYRFNWMSLLRSGIVVGRSVRSSVYPYFPGRRVALLLSLLSHCPFAHPPIRSYIYCIEETRAAAFLAHAPPVMSGLQSCLSFRPSVQKTGRPVAFHTPYSRSLLDLPPLASSFLYRRPLFFAHLAPLLFDLATVYRDVHIQMYAYQVVLFLQNLSRRQRVSRETPLFYRAFVST